MSELHLDDAIAQLITLGEKDPMQIARKLKHRYGAEWVAAELAARDEELLADLARHRLGEARRATQLATVARSERFTTAARQTRAQGELMLQSIWIPVTSRGGGWKALGDVTAADLRELAIFHARLSAAADRTSHWCSQCARLIEREQVRTLREVKAPLPTLDELPDRAELERLTR